MLSEETRRVLKDITAERERQTDRWGVQHLSGVNLEVDREYYERLADSYKAKNDRREHQGNARWDYVLLEEVYEALAEEDTVKLRAELVQSAAVIVSWIEDLDRG